MVDRATKWTYEEEQRLMRCVRSHLSYDKMLPLFPGHTRQSIRNKVNRDYVNRRDTPRSIEIPPHVIAERDIRINEYRSPAQILMGEPPPSQSALAKRHPGNGAD